MQDYSKCTTLNIDSSVLNTLDLYTLASLSSFRFTKDDICKIIML